VATCSVPAIVVTAGMPNVSPVRLTATLHLRCDKQFLDDLDDLRSKERPILSRAALLRKLVRDAKRRGRS